MYKTEYRDRETPDSIDFTIDPGEAQGDVPALLIRIKRRTKAESQFIREIRIDLDAADPNNLERLADKLVTLATNGLRSVARAMKAAV